MLSLSFGARTGRSASRQVCLAATLLSFAVFSPARAGAQDATPAQARVPKVGALAPDFALPGATRYGLLQTPVRLSDYRGKTVVLAFFFRARTKG